MILLGAKLDNPVSALICWTTDGQPTGGTGQAIRIASGYGIPVHNLFDNAQSQFGRGKLAAYRTRF